MKIITAIILGVAMWAAFYFLNPHAGNVSVENKPTTQQSGGVF